jgi:hypothetical protein
MMPPHPLPAGPPVEWSKKAIACIILACIGFATLWLVFGLFIAAIAAVCGHLARHEMTVHPFRGRRLASLGLGLSYGSMLLFPILVLIVAISFPAFNKWRSDQDAGLKASSRASASRLFTIRRIGRHSPAVFCRPGISLNCCAALIREAATRPSNWSSTTGPCLRRSVTRLSSFRKSRLLRCLKLPWFMPTEVSPHSTIPPTKNHEITSSFVDSNRILPDLLTCRR